jgi:hypothetical protein
LQRNQALKERANGVFGSFFGRFGGHFVARFRDEPPCGSALRCSGLSAKDRGGALRNMFGGFPIGGFGSGHDS